MTFRISIASVVLLAILGCVGPIPDIQDEMVEMRDGVALATDVYFPEDQEENDFPVLLVRTPYDKTFLSFATITYTQQGIAVVTQDLRGRSKSEGTDMIFTTDGDGDLKDGYDTYAWIDDQDWSNGNVVSWGASALGVVQYVAAPTDPPGLRAMMPTVATPRFYEHALFHNGVYRHSMITLWLEAQGSEHFQDTIDAHPYLDDFWDPVEPALAFDQVEVPTLHVGGWYDIFPQGPIDAFLGYQHEGGAGAVGRQKLIMGPWTHSGVGLRPQGQLVYPPESARPPVTVNEATQAFVAEYLDPIDPTSDLSVDDIPTVQYYVMGDVLDASAPGNEWRTADDWPPAAAPVRMHLQADGTLAETCADGVTATTEYVYDPADPSPTSCGGNLLIAAGPCDQTAIEARDDVRVFETPVLTEPMEITGRVKAHIFVDLDQPDTDVMVRMTDVYPDGRSMLIGDSAARVAARGSLTSITPVTAGEVVEVVVDLFSTSIILDEGHRLRISVTSSNYPRYEANLNNGLEWPDMLDGPANVVTVKVHHEPTAASYIEVPDPSRETTDFTTCP